MTSFSCRGSREAGVNWDGFVIGGLMGMMSFPDMSEAIGEEMWDCSKEAEK